MKDYKFTDDPKYKELFDAFMDSKTEEENLARRKPMMLRMKELEAEGRRQNPSKDAYCRNPEFLELQQQFFDADDEHTKLNNKATHARLRATREALEDKIHELQGMNPVRRNRRLFGKNHGSPNFN